MCGIIAISKSKPYTRTFGLYQFTDMLRDSEDRGQDSTGAAIITRDRRVVFHRVLGGVDAWVNTLTEEFIGEFENAAFILGVNRAQPVPEGDSKSVVNRQPIQSGDWVVVHNGTIGNDRELKVEYGLETKSQIDTEVAVALLDKVFDPMNPGVSVQKWAGLMSGGMAMFAVNVRTLEYVCIKNFKPLCFNSNHDISVWASERKTLEVVGYQDSKWVPPYTGFFNSPHNSFPIETLHETSIPKSDPTLALVVTSGGIDSSTAAYVAAKLHDKVPMLLHFDYGQIAAMKEWEAVQFVATELGCVAEQVDISWLGRLAETPLVSSNSELPLGIKSVETTGCWVPARNLIMLSIAAGICESLGIGSIYSGFNLEESGVYPDNDVEFLKVFNLALNYGTLRRPKLILALERIMKPEIIKLGHYLGVPYDKTWSCDLGGEKPCGQCGCCWMRQFAFKKAGIEDYQTYLNLPLESAPWSGGEVSNVVPIEDILNRVQQRGLDDLVRL